MKILHVGKFYSPIEGGIESINQFVVNSLKGNHQRIISFNNKRISVEDDIDDIPVIRASSSGILASQPISFKYYFELRRNIKMFRPNIIHFHYPNPLGALYLLLLNLKNAKLIVHWHSDVVAQKFLHKLIKPIEKKILKKATHIIATSPSYRDNSECLKPHIDKISIIPCSINEDKFQVTENDQEKIQIIRNKYLNKKIILFIGRHVEYKGIRFLLEAEKIIVSDCVFVIAGEGPLTNSLKQEFKSDRIHWIGKLPDSELKLYYQAADILAFPSITRNEAFGVVLAEAMYCGCPPVTFTIPGSGVNWVSINNLTGLEVENQNIAAYAQAIDTLINDKVKYEKFKNNSIIRVKELFTREKVAELYQDLYSIL